MPPAAIVSGTKQAFLIPHAAGPSPQQETHFQIKCNTSDVQFLLFIWAGLFFNKYCWYDKLMTMFLQFNKYHATGL